MKLFQTCDINVVKLCQELFNFKLSSLTLATHARNTWKNILKVMFANFILCRVTHKKVDHFILLLTACIPHTY